MVTRRNTFHSEANEGIKTEEMRRPTFYLPPKLDDELAEEARASKTSKSGIVSELLYLLFMTPQGRRLRHSAKRNNATLAEEVEKYLVPFQEDFPTERISELAKLSYRTPTQMLVYLVLIGLRVYEKNLVRLEEEINKSKDNL